MRQRMGSKGKKEDEIRSRLGSVGDIAELKVIYQNIYQQGNSLKQDVDMLKHKLQLCNNKHKQDFKPEDFLTLQQIQTLKLELKLQEKIRLELKKKREAHISEKGTEELNQQAERLQNDLKEVESKVIDFKKQAEDLQLEIKQLQQSLGTQEDELKKNDPKIASFTQENNSLKRKIAALRKVQSEKQYQSAKVVNSMYSIKNKFNKNQNILVEEKKKLSDLKAQTVPDKKQIVNIEALEKEVEGLKKEMERYSKVQASEEQSNRNRKEELIERNKELVKELKHLSQGLSRSQRELNKYKKIWMEHLESKNNNKNLKDYQESDIQADQFLNEFAPLRRDFAGVFGNKFRFDDRVALRENAKAYIKGFYVYEIENVASGKNMLIGIRAIYDDEVANSLNQLPLPGSYLQKCKESKYMMNEGDFVKLLKVKFNSVEGKIVKVEIRTNKNNKYQFGDKRSFNDIGVGENVYGFDISINEYPVCLFGSYVSIRSHWCLESLGVEVNEF